MISPEFLALLRCPLTGQTLELADSGLLARLNALPSLPAGEVVSFEGSAAPGHPPLDAALIRADQKVLYPIRDGIPVLLAEEAILL